MRLLRSEEAGNDSDAAIIENRRATGKSRDPYDPYPGNCMV